MGRTEQSNLLHQQASSGFSDSETGTDVGSDPVVKTPPKPQYASWEIALRYAPALYMFFMYFGLAIAFAACDDVRGAFGDVGQLSEPDSYAPDAKWAFHTYQYAWGLACLTLFLVGWALWRTGADVVECAGDEEEFAPAATMTALCIAGLLYCVAGACVLSAAALHLFSSIGIRAFLSLGVIGYNMAMASAGLLVQLTTLGSLGEIKGTLWFRALFLIAWMFCVWWFGERKKNATTLVLLTNSVVLMLNAQVDILAFYNHHSFTRQPRSYFMWFLMAIVAAGTITVTVKFLENVAFLIDQKKLVKDNHEYLPPF